MTSSQPTAPRGAIAPENGPTSLGHLISGLIAAVVLAVGLAPAVQPAPVSAQVARRMGSGGRAAAHLAAADIVIDNSGARGATAVQVERAWRSLQRWPPNLHSDESNELDPKTP